MRKISIYVFYFLIAGGLYGCSGGSRVSTDDTVTGGSNGTFNIVSLPKYYEGAGAIVPQDYPLMFENIKSAERFTPSLEEIREAESLFQNKYDSLSTAADIERSQKSFNNHSRQYIGYVNQQGHKVVIIMTMNLTAENADRRFKGWQKDVVVGSGDFFERNQWLFTADLSANRFSLY